MTPEEPELPPPPKQDPEALVLRVRPRPVLRFRRGVVVGGIAAACASIATIAWLALEPPSFHLLAPADEGGEAARNAASDSLAGLPSSYGDVPKLGPPLPGDLGKPILDHQRAIGAQVDPGASNAGEVDRAAAERAGQLRAARESGLMIQTAARSAAQEPARPAVDAVAADLASPVDRGVAGADPNGQQHKLEFVRAEGGDVNSGRIVAAPSRWVLSAGTVIPASLVTGLNSDLPGMVVAQVTANVFDSATGRVLLVPQGARLIGRYDSLVAYGQKRALLVWERMLFPDGSSVRLDRLPATDLSGYAGLDDKLDRHSWELVKGIGLSTLLGVGTELSFGRGEGDLLRALRESSQQGAANVGSQITAHNLDVQPTVRVRPGWPVLTVLNKDLVLRPWTEGR